jgi:hypothetical protein
MYLKRNRMMMLMDSRPKIAAGKHHLRHHRPRNRPVEVWTPPEAADLPPRTACEKQRSE